MYHTQVGRRKSYSFARLITRMETADVLTAKAMETL